MRTFSTGMKNPVHIKYRVRTLFYDIMQSVVFLMMVEKHLVKVNYNKVRNILKSSHERIKDIETYLLAILLFIYNTKLMQHLFP